MTDVTLQNVYIGMRVERGRHWRDDKWHEDNHLPGTIKAYTNADGMLVEQNSKGEYITDCVVEQTGPAWVVVYWDTQKKSINPIGATGPLGRWWTKSKKKTDHGPPCFSLVQVR